MLEKSRVIKKVTLPDGTKVHPIAGGLDEPLAGGTTTKEESSMTGSAASVSAAGEATPNRESAPSLPGVKRMDRRTNYARHANPITGAGLLDRGLKELDRLVPQVVITVENYNFYGYRDVQGSGLELAYGHSRVKDLAEKEWYRNLIESALLTGSILTIDFNGAAPAPLANANFLESYVHMYVRTAVNLRNLGAVMAMGDLNEGMASFLLDANIGGSGRFRRLRNLLEQLSQVPIPAFWSQRAVALAGVYKSGVGEPVILRLIGNWTHCTEGEMKYQKIADNPVTVRREDYRIDDLTQYASYFVGDEAKAFWADAILNDAAWCVDALNGRSDYTNWNSDVIKVHDLWHLTNVGPQRIPAILETPLDSKFDYLSLVNDRPWMWAEEAANTRDNLILTNHVPEEMQTTIREFADSPPREWYAGYGVWAMTHSEKAKVEAAIFATGTGTDGNDPVSEVADLVKGFFEGEAVRVYGEMDPWILSPSLAVSAGNRPAGLQSRVLAFLQKQLSQLKTFTITATNDKAPEPFYIWYNRRDRWHQGLRSIDDALMKNSGAQAGVSPTLDPLFNRNVNLVKAARVLHQESVVGKYPVNRPYAMELVEQDLDDLSNGWLMETSPGLLMPEN